MTLMFCDELENGADDEWTMEIPDDLWERVKAVAHRRNVSTEEVVVKAIEIGYHDAKAAVAS